MKIAEALRNVKKLGIETAPFIYFLENHLKYADKMDAVFAIVESTQIEIYTSSITLTETLIKPIKAGDDLLLKLYLELLTGTDYVHIIPITIAEAQRAAHLRAKYNLRTPDALHIASALETNCDAFLTNDKELSRVKELHVLVLDELEL